MATRKPLIVVGDKLQEITAPDTIDPSVLPTLASQRTFAFFVAS